MADKTVHESELYSQVAELAQVTSSLLQNIDQGPMTKEKSDEVKASLVAVQRLLGNAFPTLKMIRRVIFALEPASR